MRPKGITGAHALSLSCNPTLSARNAFGFLFCLRVIVYEKPLNPEKTTSSILSVLLILYASDNQRKLTELHTSFIKLKNRRNLPHN